MVEFNIFTSLILTFPELSVRNPVPVMPLEEVIRGLRTDDATLELTLQLCRAMKKDRRERLILLAVFFQANLIAAIPRAICSSGGPRPRISPRGHGKDLGKSFVTLGFLHLRDLESKIKIAYTMPFFFRGILLECCKSSTVLQTSNKDCSNLNQTGSGCSMIKTQVCLWAKSLLILQ